jgi:L-seryl-tRNA(Ser) seleniumtransferase
MRTTASAPWDTIPSTQAVLQHPALSSVGLEAGLLAALVRDAIQQLRADPPSTREAALDAIIARVTQAALAFRLPRRRYVNATGIVIHTQWGNAPLSSAARQRLLDTTGASPTGAREIEDRAAACERLLVALTGAEAAAVTTQNAASCLLVAASLAQGRDLVCAARDLIEISQGARLRDILEAGGARVVPVGAANCVYPEDYRRAIGPQTAAVLRIHASNTATTGYTAHVEATALAHITRDARLPLVVNLGSGSLVDLRDRGLPYAPTIRDALRDGADLALASGDKLVGGPQAGVICGRRELIERLTCHPVARCCRPGKLTLAALEATLASYVAGRAWEEVPVLRLLSTSTDALRQRAEALVDRLRGGDLAVDIAPDTTECGGAALPGVLLPTWTVRLTHPALGCDALHAALLRRGVAARRRDGAVVLDLRSVLPEDDPAVAAALLVDPTPR